MNTNSPSRRTMLQWSAAALAAAALRPRPSLGADTDAFGGLKLGIQSYTLRSMGFEKMLQTMNKELDLHLVELYPGHTTGFGPTKVLEALKENDVKAISYGVVPFGKSMDENRKLFEYAKTLGFTNLSCDPDPESFDSLDKLTEEYKITAAIHDHGPGHRWGKIDTIAAAIKDHSKMIGLCNDTGHFIRAGEDPLKAMEVFKDRLYDVHLKDFKKDSKGNFEDCVAGDGSLDVPGIIKFLINNKYQGGVFIEYEGGDPVVATQKSIERVKEAVKKAQ